MKLSELIKVWDILHQEDLGELGFCNLADAIETVAGLDNDIVSCQPDKGIR